MLPTMALGALALRVALGPYVQDVRQDGFTVAYETDTPADGTVVVGDKKVETHGFRHEARVDGLKPGTHYKYRVLVDGKAQVESETSTFGEGGALTFAVFGDTRDGDVARAFADTIRAESPDLALFTGDLVRSGGDEDGWRTFFADVQPLAQTIPIFPTVGNHELLSDEEGAHFRHYWVLPEEGRARRYYTFRAGPAQFVVLDGNARYAEQAAWLERTLTEADGAKVPHVFVLVHQPLLSTAGHCGQETPLNPWIPILEHHRVRAVFAGHDHCYERLERLGVRYFISGGGGAPLYDERSNCPTYDHAARRVYAAEHHWLRVRVQGESVEVAALRLDGSSIETVRYGANDLVAMGPVPPLLDDRLLGGGTVVGGAVDALGSRWTVGAGLLALLVIARLLRRRTAR
jgi:hypothetical protein